MWILALTGKLCSVVFFFAAWWFYIPPKQIPPMEEEVNVKDNVNSSALISTVESVMVVASTS